MNLAKGCENKLNIILTSQALIFIPIVFSVLIYLFNNKFVSYIAYVAQIFLTIFSFIMWKYLIKNGVITILLGGWNKSIGIELRIDNLSMLFITMTVLIWWLVLIYSWEQKKKDYKFFIFLIVFRGFFYSTSSK